MMYEAKNKISVIFEEVEKQIISNHDEKALKKLSELKEKVIEAMVKYDTLKKWSAYKTTPEFKETIEMFKDDSYDSYLKISLACEYFQKPCFFNED